MSTHFAGITFANQNATPSDDAIIRRAMLEDGVLTGCELSYTGSTLTMQPGQLMICGRQIRHPAVQNWPIVDANSGFARILLTIDLTKTSTKDTFEQVEAAIEYASSEAGFPGLTQSDINDSGTIYQEVLCVVSLAAGGISGITYRIPESGSISAGGAGASLTVLAPAGARVTASKDGKTYTRTANAQGTAVFKGLSTGTWIVKITAGDQESSQAVEITADYCVTMSFFSAVISVTYPAGSTCTCSKGAAVLTAPDTSGSAVFHVPEAGDWTVTCTDGSRTRSKTIAIAQDGQAESAALAYTLAAFDNGDQCEEVTGGWWRNTAVSYGPNNSYPNSGNVYIGTSIGCTSFSAQSACAWTKELIDVTAYSTIRITAGEVHTGSSRDFCLVPADAESVEASNAACVKLTASQESALDISALSGSYYFVVTAVDGKYTTVNKIVME